MGLAGVQRLTRFLPLAFHLSPIIYNSTRNHAASIFSYDGPVRAGYADRLLCLGQASDTAPSSGIFTQTIPALVPITLPERVRTRVYRDRFCVCCVSGWGCF